MQNPCLTQDTDTTEPCNEILGLKSPVLSPKVCIDHTLKKLRFILFDRQNNAEYLTSYEVNRENSQRKLTTYQFSGTIV